MIRNYLVIALRNFWKYKVFTSINLIGLAIALTCAILIYLFIQHEFTFDAFHTKKERIFRVVFVEKDLGTGANDYTVAQPYPLGPAMLQDLPEVENFVRISFSNKSYIRQDQEVFEEEFTFADSTLFEVFSFPVLYGNPKQALNQPNAIAISQKAAKKYFGDTNPLGQTLSIRAGNEFENYEVSAIFKNIPSNSTISSDFFLPMMKESIGKFHSHISDPDADLWSVFSYTTFLLLHEKASVAELNKKLPNFRSQYHPTDVEYLQERKEKAGETLTRAYWLQNLTNIHLNTELPLESRGSKPIYSYVLAGIGGCILLLGAINFTLLSISRSNSRAKEVGVRKVVGASRKQLAFQFWSEAFLTSFLALTIAMMLSWLTLPLFNEMAHKELSFNSLFNPLSLFVLIILMGITGAVAGGYPSMMLARLKLQTVLKNKVQSTKSATLPQLLLAMQFVLPIIFLTVTTVMIAQLRFLREKDLGFQTDQILVIENKTNDKRQTYERFKQLAQLQTEVQAIVAANASFTKSGFMYGMRRREEDKVQLISSYSVEPGFFDVLDIKTTAGRVFDSRIASDSVNAIVVNETFVKTFGFTDPVGEEIERYSIIGVVKDFNFESLAATIEPIAFYQASNRTDLRYILVKLQSNHLSESIATFSKLWNQLDNDLPFQYSFLDDDMQALYDEDERWARILQCISGLSVFIACMGLIGVVGLTVAKRTKEIGIRKILGASLGSLLFLLSKDYFRLVLIAFMVAIPIANYFITEWLQNFAYHINISWWMFAVPGLLIIVITLFSVIGQSQKAAHTNPVDSLRYE